MIAPMITRRETLGGGLAAVAAMAAPMLAATPASAAPGVDALRLDALLVDDAIHLPAAITALVEVLQPATTIVPLRLDAAGLADVARVLRRGAVVAGISSGASLFCLERIAWDSGFRLASRRAVSATGATFEDCRRELAPVLQGQVSTAGNLAAIRHYAPSRTDGVVHVWLLHKPARNVPRHDGYTA